MLYHREREIAIAATLAAATLCERVRHSQQEQTMTKADSSPVTVADFGAQALICQALAANFPDDSIVGEEDAHVLQQPESRAILEQVTAQVQVLRPDATQEDVITWINHGNGQISQRYWTLDPIDGTKGFIRGDQYAIALALIEQGEVKLGILGCPAFPGDHQEQGVIFVAVQGQGTEMLSLHSGQSRSLRVKATDNPSQLCLIESLETAHGNRPQQRAIAQALKFGQKTQQMDSQAKYGAIALGQADLYLRIPLPQSQHKKENIWDHAPGAIIVTEAGGKVTDLDGKPFDLTSNIKMENNRGILASNGIIHEQVLAQIRNL